ncbi:MAG: response regulator [Acidobacteriota bacterium]
MITTDRKKTILIVEDDKHERTVLCDILQQKGYTPEAVSEGQSALELAREQQPTVALIDFKLEDISGLEVLQGIQKNSPATQCIMLTGFGSEEIASEVVNQGAYGYLRKPFDMEQLLLLIVRAVEKQEADDRLHSLSRRLLQVQEVERSHLARELHDEIGQLLTAIKLNLQALGGAFGPETAPRQLEESIRMLDQLLTQVRQLSLDLRPPLLDDLGLIAALGWYLDQQGQRSGLQAEFIPDPSLGRMNGDIETACFRIAQEAVTNVVRHAQAKRVSVEVRQENAILHLLVRDDGVGFNHADARTRASQAESFGLMGIEERAADVGGRVEYHSMPGQGTEVHAYFPVPVEVDNR